MACPDTSATSSAILSDTATTNINSRCCSCQYISPIPVGTVGWKEATSLSKEKEFFGMRTLTQ
jgi:hypothetical protein